MAKKKELGKASDTKQKSQKAKADSIGTAKKSKKSTAPKTKELDTKNVSGAKRKSETVNTNKSKTAKSKAPKATAAKSTPLDTREAELPIAEIKEKAENENSSATAEFVGRISKKKKIETHSDDEPVLFSSVPDSFIAEDLFPVQFEVEDEKLIEEEAIASLPEAPSLELLLYDSDDGLPGHESKKENEEYETFLHEYKEAMATALSTAKAEREANEASDRTETESTDPQGEQDSKVISDSTDRLSKEGGEGPEETGEEETLKESEKPDGNTDGQSEDSEAAVSVGTEITATDSDSAELSEDSEAAVSEEAEAAATDSDSAEETEEPEAIAATEADNAALDDESVRTEEDESEDEAPLLVKDKPVSEGETNETVSEDPAEDGDSNTVQEEEARIAELLQESHEKATLHHKPTDETEEESSGGEQLEMDLGVNVSEVSPAPSEETAEQEDEKECEKKEESRPGFIHSLFEFVELFVFTFVTVMVLTGIFFRHSMVEGSSMENTLKDGDHLIISGLFYEPDYGDIVVFSSERNDGSQLVKRVVALEGDEVDCLFADGKYLLYVNNELVDESDYKYVGGEGDVLAEVNDYIVGEGEIFVLGDHRNVSHDSRSFYAVDTDRVLGKVVFRFYPFDVFGPVE